MTAVAPNTFERKVNVRWPESCAECCHSYCGPTVCIAEVGGIWTRLTGCDANKNRDDKIIKMILERVQPQNQICNVDDAEVTWSRPNFGYALLGAVDV